MADELDYAAIMQRKLERDCAEVERAIDAGDQLAARRLAGRAVAVADELLVLGAISSAIRARVSQLEARAHRVEGPAWGVGACGTGFWSSR